VIGENIADAILDRIVHDAHRIEGESLRKKLSAKNKKTTEIDNYFRVNL
jgi:hypothetical protein